MTFSRAEISDSSGARLLSLDSLFLTSVSALAVDDEWFKFWPLGSFSFSTFRSSIRGFHFANNSSHFSCNLKLSGYSRSLSLNMHLSTLWILVFLSNSKFTGNSTRRCNMSLATRSSLAVGGGNCLGFVGVTGWFL